MKAPVWILGALLSLPASAASAERRSTLSYLNFHELPLPKSTIASSINRGSGGRLSVLTVHSTMDNFREPGITIASAHDDKTVGRLTALPFHRLTNKDKPVDLTGMSDIEGFTVPSLEDGDGKRRVQSTYCENELSVVLACVPNVFCAQCLDSQFQLALLLADGGTCDDLVSGLCAVAPSCGCGCEPEAEEFNRCFVESAIPGCTVDCGDTQPDCDAEETTAASCLSAGNPSCPQCVFDAIDALFEGSEPVSCSVFESESCSAINESCGCDSCVDELVALFDCTYSETDCKGLQCDASPPPPPLPAPSNPQTAPTPPPVSIAEPDCDAEASNAASCLSAVNPSCPQCVFDAMDALFVESESVSCSVFESKSCSAIYESCGCDSCADEVVVWLDCAYSETDCEGLQCNASPPPPPLPAPSNPPMAPTPDCDAEASNAASCLSAVNPSCPQCVFDAMDALFVESESVSCSVFESKSCSAINESCGCDSCADEVVVWLDCAYSDTDCEGLQCNASPPPPPLPAPSNPPMAPTPPPVSVAEPDCDAEASNAASCLSEVNPSCPQCVYDALMEGGDYVSCSVFESKSCSAIESCGCDSCADEVVVWLDCLVSESACGGLQCSSPVNQTPENNAAPGAAPITATPPTSFDADPLAALPTMVPQENTRLAGGFVPIEGGPVLASGTTSVGQFVVIVVGLGISGTVAHW